MTVLVYGATGVQGGPVARLLLDRGTPVRVVTRDPGRVDPLTGKGAEVVAASLTDPASLRAATEGVKAVFLQLPAGVPGDGMVRLATNALTAVRDAGSPHLVLTTSSVVPSAPTGLAYADAKLRITELAADLTPHAVILRPRIYLDNLAALRPALDQGVLPHPLPATTPAAWIAAEDAAAFAVAALDRPELAGRGFDLATGPALTGPQLAERVGAALGRPVRHQEIPLADFGAQLAPFLGAEPARQIAEFYGWMGDGGSDTLAPDPGPVTAALPIVATDLDEWLNRTLKTG